MWARLGCRLGLEQSWPAEQLRSAAPGLGQGAFGAGWCRKPDSSFCDEQAALGVLSQGREKREPHGTSMRNLCFFGNCREEKTEAKSQDTFGS